MVGVVRLSLEMKLLVVVACEFHGVGGMRFGGLVLFYFFFARSMLR